MHAVRRSSECRCLQSASCRRNCYAVTDGLGRSCVALDWAGLSSLALRLDPPATPAPRAFLVPEAVMHRHAGFAPALPTLVQHARFRAPVLELDLGDVLVDADEPQLRQHHTVGEAQAADLTLPRP